MRLFLIAFAYFAVLWFARVQTDFFGSTWLPSTPLEVLADGLCVLGLVIIFCTIALCDTIDKIRKDLKQSQDSPESETKSG